MLTLTHREGRSPRDNGGGDQGDVSARTGGGHQKLEKTRKDPPLEPSEGAWNSNTLVSEFWSQKSEKIYSYCFKPPHSW